MCCEFSYCILRASPRDCTKTLKRKLASRFGHPCILRYLPSGIALQLQSEGWIPGVIITAPVYLAIICHLINSDVTLRWSHLIKDYRVLHVSKVFLNLCLQHDFPFLFNLSVFTNAMFLFVYSVSVSLSDNT